MDRLSELDNALRAERFALDGPPVVLRSDEDLQSMWWASSDGCAVAGILERVVPRAALVPVASECVQPCLTLLGQDEHLARESLEVAALPRCEAVDRLRETLRDKLRKRSTRTYVEAVDGPPEHMYRQYCTRSAGNAILFVLYALDESSDRSALAGAVTWTAQARSLDRLAGLAPQPPELPGIDPVVHAESLAHSATIIRARFACPTVAALSRSRQRNKRR